MTFYNYIEDARYEMFKLVNGWTRKGAETKGRISESLDNARIEYMQKESENAKLRKQVTQLQDDWESEHDYANQMEVKEKRAVSENAKLRKFCEDLIQLPAIPSFDCYGCVYDKWEDCGGILRDCQLIKEAIKLGIKIPSEGDN